MWLLFFFSQIFTIVRKINYNKKGITFFRKGGRLHGAHVSRSWLLDWNFLSNVLLRGYVRYSTTIFRTNRIFCTFKLFKVDRAYVYIRIRSIFNSLLHRIYILYNIFIYSWNWTLERWQLAIFFYFPQSPS